MSKYDFIKKLSKKLQVSPEKILDSPINDILQSKDKVLSWGNENPDKIFYVIRPWSGEGLVRNVQSVMKETYYARSKGYIPVVDMYTYATRYHEENEVGNINAWEKFFEQPDRYNMKDVLNSKNIIISGLSHHLLSKFEFNGIIMKPKLKEDLYKFCTFFHKKVLGVCYRGTDYNLDIGLFHPIQPTVNTAIKTVKKKIEEWGRDQKFDAIFLVTEDEMAFNMFKEEFGDMLYYLEHERFPHGCDNLIEHEKRNGQSAYENGAKYWINVIALSKCNSMIAGDCGASNMAEYFNASLYENDKKFENIYYFELGRRYYKLKDNNTRKG